MSSNNSPLNAKQALQELIEGNKRFRNDKRSFPRQDTKRREGLLGGQNPFAVIITCSDSRVPPEIIFDQGIGDLFIIRTAGNVVDEIALGSIEYAVDHLGTPLVLVLGHQSCGAVTATVMGGDEEAPGHIGSIVKKIMPAVQKAKQIEGDVIKNAIDLNIEEVVNELRNNKPILKSAFEEGKLKIGGARYDFDTGKVIFL